MTATIESKMLVELVQRFGVSKHRFTAAGQTGTSPLPNLVKLTDIPNMLSEECVAKTILLTEKEEADARCIAWAKCLGIWSVICLAPKADKALKSAVGEALNGTMARAEWDLGGVRYSSLCQRVARNCDAPSAGFTRRAQPTNNETRG